MSGHGNIGPKRENVDQDFLAVFRDDEYESRSGSENFDAVSGDDQDATGHAAFPKKKEKKQKYHRHTPHQIQELESFFREIPHPDEKQRLELGQRLGLESNQIKFWFQNRRTQMKTQLERHENTILRQENDRLRAENDLLLEAMRNPMCNSCGGPVVPGEVTFEQRQLRIENARARDELARVCALAEKFLGGPISSSVCPTPWPSGFSSSESAVAVGRNSGIGSNIPIGLDFSDGSLTRPMVGNEMMYETTIFWDLALAAMDELIEMTDSNNPNWMKLSNSGKETLNHDKYRSVFASFSGMKTPGFAVEASRESGLVLINSLDLVETLMDPNKWAEMFPCIVARASTIEVLSSGACGTRNGALQLMEAEFQLISPLVPVRQVRFLRYAKQHADGLWAVVDVSFDVNGEYQNLQYYGGCRRLPSGCIIQDAAAIGHSKVTWLEHSEYNESNVHQLYHPVLRSGVGFGAQRWIATLQRQCESFAILLSSSNLAGDHTGLSLAGSKSILNLANRMTFNFYAGISASSVLEWKKLSAGNIGEDTRILTRNNLNDPGEPSGVILSAATSLWMPVTQQRLFNFLRDPKTRTQWDILSSDGSVQEMIRIAKGQDEGNCVSLLRTDAIDQNESNTLILQETWIDASGALVVHAAVDLSSMKAVMNGGDSAYVALLPLGFAISPDGSSSSSGPVGGGQVKPEVDENGNGGCLLTVGFQISENSMPTPTLDVESVETVNNLISCTIQKIKAAIQ